MKKLLITAFLWTAAALTAAAQGVVSGKVTDSFGDPLPGVSVMSAGSGAVTDRDGRYEFTAKGSELEFSCVGMKTVSVSIDGRKTVDVQMEDDVIGLQEIIAIGYGSAKKEVHWRSLCQAASGQRLGKYIWASSVRP